jgi:LacI family transcriptional regulator
MDGMPRQSHRARDIAEQAGVSLATVDRVLHRRPGVSPRTVRAVEAAVLELDRQQSQLRLAGRALLIDVVVDAPPRFSDAVRAATEDALTATRPAAVRARFTTTDGAEADVIAATVDGVGARGRVSHGLVLKAPDHPHIADAVRRAAARGIPTVTLVTDVPDSGRVAYVGLDNEAAGATAAYLISSLVGGRPGRVLASVSHRTFLGEQERYDAFRSRLATAEPERGIETVGDVHGDDDEMARVVAEAVRRHPDVVAVYSMGGGNAGIIVALADAGVEPLAFIAHDLDADNLALLRSGALSAVLHHDLRVDLRAALTQLLRAHRLVPGAPTTARSAPQVITPWNIPPRLRGTPP